jgi:hypothetical protein
MSIKKDSQNGYWIFPEHTVLCLMPLSDDVGFYPSTQLQDCGLIYYLYINLR